MAMKLQLLTPFSVIDASTTSAATASHLQQQGSPFLEYTQSKNPILLMTESIIPPYLTLFFVDEATTNYNDWFAM